MCLNKDKFLEYNLCIMGNEEYVFRLTNRKGDTISTVRNHFKWENKTGIVGMLAGDNSESFYRYNNCLYLKVCTMILFIKSRKMNLSRLIL